MRHLLKKTHFILAVLFFIGALTFSGCDSPAQKVDTAQDDVIQAEENLTDAKNNYTEEIANFKQESNEKITAYEIMIADLKVEMKDAKKDVKASYDKQIAALEQKNLEMKRRMNDYQDDGVDKWQSFKTEFNRDMEELGNSLRGFTVDNKK
ncbi:MAG: hypothetical protein WAT79_02175 [Saprospiraceae bacterium]